MIKRVLCPTDFSDTANNAVEYAARLAQQLKVELKLVNIVTADDLEAVGVSEPVNYNASEVVEQLERISTEIKKTFGIQCTTEFDLTSEALETMISSMSGQHTLVVMGTNGVDSLFQLLNGSNAYRVIKKAKCPVWIVPQDAKWKTPKTVVYCWDRHRRRINPMPLLTELFGTTDLEIIFVHVSKSLLEKHYYHDELPAKEILDTVEGLERIRYDQVVSEDIMEGMKKSVKRHKADVMLVVSSKKTFLSQLFHHSMTREVVEVVDYPVLVLHG